MRIAAVLLVAFAVVYSVEPFTLASASNVSMPSAYGIQRADNGVLKTFELVSADTHCGAALFGAWRSDRRPSGWFGYAPLTPTPLVAVSRSSCRGTSRRRLELSLAGGGLGVGLVFAAHRLDDSSGDDEPGADERPADA